MTLRKALWVGIGVGIALAAFLLGRASGVDPTVHASQMARTSPVDASSQTAPARSVLGRRAVRDVANRAFVLDGGVQGDGGLALPVHRLVDTVLYHADFNARRSPSAPIEQIANSVQDETRGVALVAQSYPAVAADLHDEMRVRLCGDDISEVGRTVLLRMMLAAPAITDPVSIDCVLAHEQTENFVLWTALQVRQLARLPRTPEMDRWAASGTDERTRRLLGDSRRPTLSDRGAHSDAGR